VRTPPTRPCPGISASGQRASSQGGRAEGSAPAPPRVREVSSRIVDSQRNRKHVTSQELSLACSGVRSRIEQVTGPVAVLVSVCCSSCVTWRVQCSPLSVIFPVFFLHTSSVCGVVCRDGAVVTTLPLHYLSTGVDRTCRGGVAGSPAVAEPSSGCRVPVSLPPLPLVPAPFVVFALTRRFSFRHWSRQIRTS